MRQHRAAATETTGRQRRKCRAIDRQVLERRGHRSTSPAPTQPLSRQMGAALAPFASGAESGVVVPVPSSTSRTTPASRFSTRSATTAGWAEREPTSSSLAPPDVVGHLPPRSSCEDDEGEPAQVSLARPGPAAQPQSGRTRTSRGQGCTSTACRAARPRPRGPAPTQLDPTSADGHRGHPFVSPSSARPCRHHAHPLIVRLASSQPRGRPQPRHPAPPTGRHTTRGHGRPTRARRPRPTPARGLHPIPTQTGAPHPMT
jgi:hypothetical protein